MPTEVMTVAHDSRSDTTLAPDPPGGGPGAPRPVPMTARPAKACRPGPTWLSQPGDLPAGTNLERLVDRVVPRRGGGCFLYWGVVLAMGFGLAPHLPVRSRLAVEAAAALLAGGWCALNFWRCRQAHCVVSGAGWLVLGLWLLAEAVIGHSLVGGNEQLLFLGVLGAAFAFEFAWYRAHGTNAMPGRGDVAAQRSP